MKNKEEWLDFRQFKPNKTGFYQVSPDPWKSDQARRNVRYAEWDGVGFIRGAKYIQVRFWKEFNL